MIPLENSEHILVDTPAPADARIRYGDAPSQFCDLRVPKGTGPFAAAVFIHGGFWRARYDLTHAGFLCAALTGAGWMTCNLEYRRVGDPGGGWPASFEDVTEGYRALTKLAASYPLDPARVTVVGHSAGGQLALALAAHEKSMTAVVSLAGVLNLRRAWELHLSNDAVVEFLGGTPEQVPKRYREASPAVLPIACRQLIVHGSRDDTVPAAMSRDYVEQKQQEGENIRLLEIPEAGHFEIIDPRSKVWIEVEKAIAPLAAC